MSGAGRFVILGSQRTGTTLVRTTLDSHARIRCHGEVFKLGRRPYRQLGGYWEYSHQSIGRQIRSLLAPRSTIESYLRQLYRETAYAAIGFKLMLNQCLARPYIVELLRGLGVRVILVRRSNLLKTLVSRKAAESSGVYHVSKSLDSDSAVTAWRAEGVYINTACLLGELDAIKQENETWLRILDSRFQILHVHYEEYIADPASGNASLLDFLEIEASGLRTDLEKVNPDNLRQAITNYEDVHRALQGTRYLAMMETPSDGISH